MFALDENPNGRDGGSVPPVGAYGRRSPSILRCHSPPTCAAARRARNVITLDGFPRGSTTKFPFVWSSFPPPVPQTFGGEDRERVPHPRVAAVPERRREIETDKDVVEVVPGIPEPVPSLVPLRLVEEARSEEPREDRVVGQGADIARSV